MEVENLLHSFRSHLLFHSAKFFHLLLFFVESIKKNVVLSKQEINTFSEFG